jgi:glycosyltransferase involved in cell wall biosynthesis
MIIYTNKLDTSFNRNDILAYHKLDQRIIVLYETESPIPKALEPFATFIHLKPLGNRLSPLFLVKNIGRFIGFFMSLDYRDFLKVITQNGTLEVLINYQNALHKIQSLSKADLKAIEGEDLLVSFWFYDLHVPILLKKQGLIQRLISRSHRGDTYEGEIGVRNLFLRRFHLNAVDKLHPISLNAENFLKELYPAFSSKIQCMYLGSYRYFAEYTLKRESTKKTFVSCSWINNKKNVHIIPEILSNMDFDFHWYHFGSGPDEWQQKLMSAIDTNGLAEHFTFMGNTKNEDIQQFYSANYVDALISVSSTEGVPVSFMEAMSYGIPVYATNVGGNSEIVNEQNGQLFPLSYGADEASKELLKLLGKNLDRRNIISFWEKNFDILNNNSRLLSAS